MTTGIDSATGSGLPAAYSFPADARPYLTIRDEPDLEPGLSGMARFRWQIEEEIERLISMLDAIDGDPDFEQSACETHGLGFPNDPSRDDAEALS